MKSVIYKGDGKIALEDVPIPELTDPTGVLVKVSLSTICGSDTHILRNETVNLKPPFPIGHEFMGVVEKVGSDVKEIKVGDRVAGPPAVYCEQCYMCRHGLHGHCENGGIFGHGPTYGGLDGAMSEYVRVPRADSCLCKVPDNVTDEQALFVGDILQTAYSAVCDAKIVHGDTVVIFGLGPVGQCALLSVRLFNPSQIIVVGGHDKARTEMALRLGADVALLSSEEKDIPGRIREMTDGYGADDVIECAGKEESFVNACLCARVGGHISMPGMFGAPATLPMPDICQKNLTIVNGLGDCALIPRVMKMVAAGKMDPSQLITHRMSIDQIDEAFNLFVNQPEPCMKIALHF